MSKRKYLKTILFSNKIYSCYKTVLKLNDITSIISVCCSIVCFPHFAKDFSHFPAVRSESTSVIQLEKCSHIRSTFMCIYVCYFVCVNHFETTGLCVCVCVCVCVCTRNSISNFRHLPVKESWTRTDSMQETQENSLSVTYECWTITCHIHIKTSFHSILTAL